MQTFSIRELREHSGELCSIAEQGQCALITRHGWPLFICVPFTDQLLQYGVPTALAVNLYQSGALTAARSAKIAGMTLAKFLELLSAQGIPVVNYDPDELSQELETFATQR